MVLRCSLLGHDYGDTEVDREREERGSEVVVTVEEYEECVRCGERNVISENTEVTSLSVKTDADSRPPESDPDATEPTDSDAISTGETPPDAAVDTGPEVEFTDDDDDAEFIDADGEAEPAAEDPTPAGADAQATDSESDDIDVPTDEHGEPVTDDGEILEDDDETPVDRDRERGEWPDSEDVGPPVGENNEPNTWPDSDESGGTTTDAATDTDTADTAVDPKAEATEEMDDAVVLEDSTGKIAGSGAGESTAAADARSVTAEPPNDTIARDTADAADGTESADNGDSGTGIKRASSAPSPGQSGGTPSEDVPTEFYCPQCEHVTSGDRGSLRAGDICPECRKGYLSERELR